MKKHFVLIGNLLAVFTGLLGLKAPLITDAFIAAGISGILDEALLQPLFLVSIVIALYGQIIKVKDTLSFAPIILELLFGVVGFFFIFPFENLIVGYVCLGGLFFLIFFTAVKKFLRKKKIVTIKV